MNSSIVICVDKVLIISNVYVYMIIGRLQSKLPYEKRIHSEDMYTVLKYVLNIKYKLLGSTWHWASKLYANSLAAT